MRGSINTKRSPAVWLSAATHGCYFIPKSDVDILAVTAEPVTELQAREILQAINHLNYQRPHTDSLELSIVLEESALMPDHPISYELHFGEERLG